MVWGFADGICQIKTANSVSFKITWYLIIFKPIHWGDTKPREKSIKANYNRQGKYGLIPVSIAGKCMRTSHDVLVLVLIGQESGASLVANQSHSPVLFF